MNDETKPESPDVRDRIAQKIWINSLAAIVGEDRDDREHLWPEWRGTMAGWYAFKAADAVLELLKTAAASDVLTPERRAAIGRAATALTLERTDVDLPPTMTSSERTRAILAAMQELIDARKSLTDDDLATLREMAS